MTAKSSAPQNRHSHISALASVSHSPFCSLHRVCIPLNQQQKLGKRFEFHFPQHQQQCSFVFFLSLLLLPLLCLPLLLLLVVLQLLLLPPQVLTEIYGMCRVQSAECKVCSAGSPGAVAVDGCRLLRLLWHQTVDVCKDNTTRGNTARHGRGQHCATQHSIAEQSRAEHSTAKSRIK